MSSQRRIATLPMLQRETAAWRRDVNRQDLRFNWRSTSRKARATFHYSHRNTPLLRVRAAVGRA